MEINQQFLFRFFIFLCLKKFFFVQVQAEKQLWEHKAKQILNRDEPLVQDDNSNPDDTDSPDGGVGTGGRDGTGDGDNQIDREQT